MVKEMSVIHASYLAFTASTLLAGTQNKQLDEEEGRQPPETSLIIWLPRQQPHKGSSFQSAAGVGTASFEG